MFLSHLDKLQRLERLSFEDNKINKIEGLGKLENLRELNLHGNKISQIKGLGNLHKLKLLRIGNNQIPKKILDLLGGIDDKGYAIDVKRFVEYSLKKQNKIKN